MVSFDIQVCWDLTEENREREFGGLTAASAMLPGVRGLLPTRNQEEAPAGEVRVMTVWEWILEGENSPE